jgi:glycosyltransferase involved in cell wall biosynthesis
VKILITANSSWNVFHFRRPILDALLADGHEVIILAPDDGYESILESLGCQFHALTIDLKGLSPARDFVLALRMVRAFRKLRPDIVLSYTIKNNIYGAMAARILGVPFIPTVTGLGTAFLSGPLLQTLVEALCRIAFKASPFIFFQNGEDEKLFVSRALVRRQQVRRAPGSGIDLDYFRPMETVAETRGPTFLMIARLLRDKGVLEYAEAARRVLKRRPDARFLMAGPVSPENRSALGEDIIDIWRREGVIMHVGEARDIRPHIAAADCIVLPSYREGAPRTLIEASAMGKPVIATDVPGCRDVVVDGITGILCRPRDAESLAEAMLRMIAMTGEKHAAMGAAGRARMAEHHDQRLVVKAYKAALTETASRGHEGLFS